MEKIEAHAQNWYSNQERLMKSNYYKKLNIELNVPGDT